MIGVCPLVNKELGGFDVAVLGGHHEKRVAMIVHLVQIERLLVGSQCESSGGPDGGGWSAVEVG